MKKIAFIFPGQGAQFVGMGKDFADHFAVAKETFQEADDLLKMPLSKLIFEGPKDELTLTKNSQLAIFVTSIAILRVVESQFPDLKPFVTAGLSLGEYTALVAAGKLSFQEALPLVRDRALFMHEACERTEGTMRVSLNLTPEQVEKALKGSAATIANLNCPGQVVVAGPKDAMADAEERLKKAGAKRVLPIDVAGAFHSSLMKEAQERLKPEIEKLELKKGRASLVMNVIGDFAKEDKIQSQMIAQVTSPVLWEKGVRAMDAAGVDLYIEMGPGKTLQGMNKRIAPKGETLAIDSVSALEQLEGALA